MYDNVCMYITYVHIIRSEYSFINYIVICMIQYIRPKAPTRREGAPPPTLKREILAVRFMLDAPILGPNLGC